MLQNSPDHARPVSGPPILSNDPEYSLSPAFQYWEPVLQEACIILAQVRIGSPALSPISVLPSEILISILSFTVDECLRTCFAPTRSSSRPKSPAWASVCTRWRELYLRWHATSSHLDLILGVDTEDAYYRHAEIVAGRSLDAPLHLVIRHRVSSTGSAVSSDKVARLIRFVTPLMPRVCALDIALEKKSQLLLDSVVASWLEGCPGALPKVFKVWNSFTEEPLQLIRPPTQLSSEKQLSPTYCWDFFRSLQTLILQHCYAPSSSGVFTGLVDLHLDWSHKNPDPLDILAILAASPSLRSLTIDDVKCIDQGGSPEMVWLNSLQNLSLGQYQIENSLNRFLPWLNSASTSINVIMRIVPNPDFIPESHDFFHRSSVKRLFAYGVDGYRCTLVAQLCPAPELEELSLRDCTLIIDPSGASSSTMADKNDYVRTPWPLLHTLHLIKCTVDLETIQQLVALHPIRKLRLYRCCLDNDWRQMTTGECAEFEELLSEAGVNDVKCIQDQIDCPTRMNFFDGMYA